MGGKISHRLNPNGISTGELSPRLACSKSVMDIKPLKAELDFRTSRSSGSGGQHVNKVATRVELLFDVDRSQFLTDAQKKRIRRIYKTFLICQ